MSRNFIFKNPNDLYSKSISESSACKAKTIALNANNSDELFKPYNDFFDQLVETFNTQLKERTKKAQKHLIRETKARTNCFLFFSLFCAIAAMFERYGLSAVAFLMVFYQFSMIFGAKYSFEKEYFENAYSGMCEVVLATRIFYENLYTLPEVVKVLEDKCTERASIFNFGNIMNAPRLTVIDCSSFIDKNISTIMFERMQEAFTVFATNSIVINSIIHEYDAACKLVKQNPLETKL